MEAAIRWSDSSSSSSRRFLIADVAGNRVQYCQAERLDGSNVKYKVLSQRDKLPNYTAFDWSRNDESLVAIGTTVGETRVLRLDSYSSFAEPIFRFPVKLQRKCNSIAWSRDDLLAVGLDRIRGDSSLNVYDARSQGGPSLSEPLKKLTGAEVITNVKFFQDGTLLAGSGGIARHGQNLKLYDLREPSNSVVASVPTRHVHYLSVNQMDGNYFASAGPQGENAVSIWDRRVMGKVSAAALSEPDLSTAVLEIRPAIDEIPTAQIWSLRYSGAKRGCLAVLSSAGQIRIYDTVEQTSRVASNGQHGSLGTRSIHFTRYSYDMQYPWSHPNFGEDESARAIAFDFANYDAFDGKAMLLTMRQNKTLRVDLVPSQPGTVHATPKNDFVVLNKTIKTLQQSTTSKAIAADLIEIQAKALQKPVNGLGERKDSTNDAANQRSRIVGEQARRSSRERHEDLFDFSLARAHLGLADLMTVMDTQRRRCMEGYLFDCDHNQQVVKNDAWLVEVWETVKRLNHMSSNHGMIHQGLDFSYLGVHGIWNARFGPNQHRIWRRTSATRKDCANAATIMMATQGYGKYEGVETEYPGLRHLGLAVCGWMFDGRRLREKCVEIISRKEYYKALVVAVCHGRRDMAMELLKNLTRTRVMENSGLAAVIACESVNQEQRELCEWMAEEAEDPYLKALLAYFVTGEWEYIVAMTELPLVYRVAVALKYLEDDKLGNFLEKATAEAIKMGDTEGIVLTGLSEPSMDLLQNYVAKFNDLQTAVLVSSFTNPRYIEKDARWEMWKDAYFANLQSWGAFMQRGRFVSQHTRLATSRAKQLLTQTPPNLLTVRCLNCQGSIAKRDEGYDSSDDESTSSRASMLGHIKTPSASAGNICPRCGAHMTRCAVCQLWQGSPNPSIQSAAAVLADQDLMGSFLSFCVLCNHGFHANHAREWFTQYSTCAVPDCHCTCSFDI